MGELVELQVDDQIAAQEPIVEDEIEEVVVAIEGETLLPGLEEKAFAQLEQELFQMGDDGGFKLGFGVIGLFGEAEEFQHERFLEEIFRLRDDLPLAGEAFNAGFVSAEGEALVKAGSFLTAEFWDRPAGVGGFDFVEAALVWVFDWEQLDIVSPAKGERTAGFSSRLLLYLDGSRDRRRCL
jgi:hypothetical protein